MASFHFNRENDDSDITLDQANARANNPFAPKPKVDPSVAPETPASAAAAPVPPVFGKPTTKLPTQPLTAPKPVSAPSQPSEGLPFSRPIPARQEATAYAPRTSADEYSYDDIPEQVQPVIPAPVIQQPAVSQPVQAPSMQQPIYQPQVPAAAPAQQNPAVNPLGNPLEVNPADNYAQQQVAQPQMMQPQQTEPQSQFIPPVAPIASAYIEPQVKAKRGKGGQSKEEKPGFWTPRPKKAKEKNSGSGFWSAKPKDAKSSRISDYNGRRGQIRWLRYGVIAVIALLAFGGFKSAFLPNNGPSTSSITSAAETAVNYTGFPTESGAVFAQQFVQQFMTYSSTESSDARTARLSDFVSPDLLQQIDITPVSTNTDTSGTSVDTSGNGPIITQTITGGPVVVASKNISKSQAVFTVKFQLNKETDWVYLNVPVKFTEKSQAMTVAGPPSFTKSNQNVGSTTSAEYIASFASTDDTLSKKLNSSISSYLQAWGSSNQTIISRYTAASATQDASSGLQGSVVFHHLDSLTIEGYTKNNPSTATVRRAEIQVEWEDPKTQLVYKQEYRMLLQLNSAQQWTIYDIQNFSLLN